ncbi:mannan endo-1,4-beta-mannosidase 7-like [Impatiens glandulifera]|uniref:mannan endo-1,4-beta-mannosidase 7-like n=1 Tax=Impatiens glandulifera TaxID=253017 RepID=UPI001FB0E7FB|nr:mannan endo-1,4-beta-mannosidase 7-like [Impatiens glandulifera]
MRNCKALLLLLVFSIILIINNQIRAEISKVGSSDQFIRTRGVQFIQNGKPFYANGFNAYWLMYIGTDPSERYKVTAAFSDAEKHGLSIVRTMAFNDGPGNRTLQSSPGIYNEPVFQGLDFALSEARKYGMKVLLCLSNNFKDFGGKIQYVEWGRSKGQRIRTEDGFYTNAVVKEMYKNHVMRVLNRRNTITGIIYKNDPTIMGWELINEPRCYTDKSGATVQSWIKEMAAYVKSIDNNHMVAVGMEGFYGPSHAGRQQNNPTFQVGTDFIENNLIRDIDFATIHMYPDKWIGGSSEVKEDAFLNDWINNHVQDAQNIIRKPLIFTEFQKNSKDPGFNIVQRDNMFKTIYSAVYLSAVRRGAVSGALFWHLLTTGLDSFRDGNAIILSEKTSTNILIAEESAKLKKITNMYASIDS